MLDLTRNEFGNLNAFVAVTSDASQLGPPAAAHRQHFDSFP